MANMCDFEMRVAGRRVDIAAFFDAMEQRGKYIMGRGASADIYYDDDEPTTKATIYGYCKWSVMSALVDNAIDMRKHPENWCWPGSDERDDDCEYITLFEACRKWNLDMEVYSAESGCCFQEHYMIEDGTLTCEDCVDYYEYYIGDYETIEEAEAELDTDITNEEWLEGEFITRGGFEWEFSI